MTITLWGRSSSANVQKVIWTLGELGLAYDHIPLGGVHGGLDTPEYRAMNPNGLVPTLRDGDLTVWESHAIVRYLAAAYGAGTLFPLEPSRRAVTDQWTDWTATTFQPAWISVFWLLVRTPEARRDMAAIEQARSAAIGCYRMLDARLADVPFVGGEQLSYADIVAGSSMFRWMTMPLERAELPNVAGWYERLKARPAFVHAVCVDFSELVGRLAY